MVYKLFGKKTFSSGIKNENISNEIITFKKRKVHSPFMENVWGVDLEDMQLRSKFNKGFKLYYVLLIFIVNMYGLFL